MKKKIKIQNKLQNKSKHKNKKCFSWVNAVMVLSLTGVTFHLTFLGCPATLCWPLDLWWEQLRFQSGPIPVCSCLQRPQLSELVCFVLRELSLSFYIVHRHRVCLPDHVDLIWSLYSWWEGLGSSSLATYAPVFQLWFYFHLYMWVFHWGLAPGAALKALGLLLWGPGVEVVQLLGSQGFSQHQVLRGVGG